MQLANIWDEKYHLALMEPPCIETTKIKKTRLKIVPLGGPQSTVDSNLASYQAASGSILGVPRLINSELLREWTVQSLVVDPTHLVLVNGKLVQQKGLTRIKNVHKLWQRFWLGRLSVVFQTQIF